MALAVDLMDKLNLLNSYPLTEYEGEKLTDIRTV
jgi:hypothetical protein